MSKRLILAALAVLFSGCTVNVPISNPKVVTPGMAVTPNLAVAQPSVQPNTSLSAEDAQRVTSSAPPPEEPCSATFSHIGPDTYGAYKGVELPPDFEALKTEAEVDAAIAKKLAGARAKCFRVYYPAAAAVYESRT